MKELQTQDVKKIYFKYLLPSVTGTLSIGILIFIDTVFIGRGIGSLGLAALNTALPAFSIYASLGILLGIGGATVSSIESGRGNTSGKGAIFTSSVVLTIIIGVFYTLIQQVFLEEFAYLLGATESTLSYVMSYIGVISIFTLMYALPHTLNAFIRNDNNPNLAMVGMIICGLMNIVLDYIFIFKFNWGMAGAALATGIAQLSYFLTLLTHFKSSKCTLALEKLKFSVKTISRIVKIGFPSFLNELTLGGAIFAFNLVLYKEVGAKGVSAYSVILNINFLVYLLYLGVSQACQPIISVNFGAGRLDRVREASRLGLVSSVVIAVVTIVVMNLYKVPITKLFIPNNRELLDITSSGIPLFFSGTLFMGVNIILSMLFQSVEEAGISTLLTFSRGLLLIVVGLLFLPGLLGITGIWLTTLFAETLTLLMALLFLSRYKELK